MSTINIIKDGLDSIMSLHEIFNGARLNTHCLYPNNSLVQVVVMGVENSFKVTDDGGALRECSVAGAEVENPDARFAKMLKAQGLSIKNGIIQSPRVSADALPVAIALVANASKEVSDRIFDTYKITRTRNFKAMLKKFLKQEFLDTNLVERQFIGGSNKPHNFDNVILLSGGRILAVDAVLKDANSINSRLVANIDVKAANHDGLMQRIVYDDVEDWSAADLNLLQVGGVPIIPFSKSIETLRRVASA